MNAEPAMWRTFQESESYNYFVRVHISYPHAMYGEYIININLCYIILQKVFHHVVSIISVLIC